MNTPQGSHIRLAARRCAVLKRGIVGLPGYSHRLPRLATVGGIRRVTKPVIHLGRLGSDLSLINPHPMPSALDYRFCRVEAGIFLGGE